MFVLKTRWQKEWRVAPHVVINGMTPAQVLERYPMRTE